MRSSSSFGCPAAIGGGRLERHRVERCLSGRRGREVLVPHRLHQCRQLTAQQPILDDRDPPRLAVASARREPGVVEDRRDGGAVDRFGGEPSRGTGGAQGGDEIHRVSSLGRVDRYSPAATFRRTMLSAEPDLNHSTCSSLNVWLHSKSTVVPSGLTIWQCTGCPGTGGRPSTLIRSSSPIASYVAGSENVNGTRPCFFAFVSWIRANDLAKITRPFR